MSPLAAVLALPSVLPDEPDLYPVLPIDAIGETPAIFVDIYEEPGKVLYRFDSVIANAGGTLQMYCENCTSARRPTASWSRRY